MSKAPEKVTRVLAKGKKLKLLDSEGKRVRHEGPKKVSVTSLQAEAFKSHWQVKEVELAEADSKAPEATKKA